MEERTPLRGFLPLRPNVGSVLTNLAQSPVLLGQIQSGLVRSGLAGIQARILEECFGSLVLKL